MVAMYRLCLALAVMLCLAGCAKHKPSAAIGMHKDEPPHGGTAVALGDGTFHIEFVREPASGRFDAYVLDDEMEEFVRASLPYFDAVALVGREIKPLRFEAIANPATGETVGDTSLYQAQADWLGYTDSFDLVILRFDIGTASFTGVTLHYPAPPGTTYGPAPKAPVPPSPLRVVTLSTVLTEVAETVGGPDVAVTGLLQPGVDPHSFEPNPADLRKLVGADLVLASGLGVEAYLDRLASNSGTDAPIIEVGDVLADHSLFIEERGRREPDPHWWNSIAATKRVVQAVTAEFCRLRPGSSAAFAARADALTTSLDALDAWARGQIAGIPPARRQLVTNHDAFAWFARDYGFTVHPISGLSPDSEPGARDLARLADLVRGDHIPAIFVESSENSALAAALSAETGARLGGMLYADGLSPDGDGATYEGMFRHNVLTIVGALRP
jgi:zinc/manganese transport system substrate-binding protein